MTDKKRDNSTFREKAALRKVMLRQLGKQPVVMETHGGMGQVWAACYASLPEGVVFEKDEGRAAHLARQRPTWAVYEADCVEALEGGAGAHLTVDVLDVDPYGEPWPTLRAFFESDRPKAPRLWVVVNDGLRQKVKLGGAWSVGSLASIVERFGNDLHGRYLEVCEVMVGEIAAQAGYSLDRFTGYYCGYLSQMTHYLALLTQRSAG